VKIFFPASRRENDAQYEGELPPDRFDGTPFVVGCH